MAHSQLFHRNRSTTGHEEEQKFTSVYTYAQRDIVAMKATSPSARAHPLPTCLTAFPTPGGAEIRQRHAAGQREGYAPIIRGTAHSNALVVVRQNGYVIYQNTVAPGAFEINDLYPTGSSGDLQVTVKETDGSESHFVVPFASVPVLQREKPALQRDRRALSFL